MYKIYSTNYTIKIISSAENIQINNQLNSYDCHLAMYKDITYLIRYRDS
jgi:hypothetical protein